MESPPLASLTLTHVHYDPSDRLSLLCAYLALLPQTLCIVYGTLILFTREVEIGILFLGQLACETVNLILKRIIKEQRPRRFHGKGYGMPSSHAQFLAFWSLSLSLFLLFRHRPRGRNAWSFSHRLALSAAAIALASLTAWSRLYLGYHSERQVLVGALAGALLALLWFAFTAWLRAVGFLAWLLQSVPARALRLRDLLVFEDLCQAGWEKWERARFPSTHARTRKNVFTLTIELNILLPGRDINSRLS
ncbi:hypothetical protein XA68_16435 [Ophiocordyceps unilateralis]|uniref:Dolichyldiphosphatase n=1 Tax=Ophiocordyceps unilateralis TaxID=268505 RepID=A0A2A9P6J0_OPHUN|nr:hypothetical protein XA68_16435 [Ophiocordyceps unilateralis]